MSLPQELINLILYQHKGVEHPIANELNKHFKNGKELLNEAWEEMDYDEKPDIEDVDCLTMLDMISISEMYELGIKNDKYFDKMKIKTLNEGASEMVFALMERNIKNFYTSQVSRAERIKIIVDSY